MRCLLVCSEWPPVANAIFTNCNSYLPLDGGLHCMYMYMSNYISHSPTASLCPFKSVVMSPHSACTCSTRLMSFACVLLPCFSLLHANDAMQHQGRCSRLCVAEIEVYHGIRQDCEVSNFLPLQKLRRKAFTE